MYELRAQKSVKCKRLCQSFNKKILSSFVIYFDPTVCSVCVRFSVQMTARRICIFTVRWSKGWIKDVTDIQKWNKTASKPHAVIIGIFKIESYIIITQSNETRPHPYRSVSVVAWRWRPRHHSKKERQNKTFYNFCLDGKIHCRAAIGFSKSTNCSAPRVSSISSRRDGLDPNLLNPPLEEEGPPLSLNSCRSNLINAVYFTFAENRDIFSVFKYFVH
jgi:hypothetical protein